MPTILQIRRRTFWRVESASPSPMLGIVMYKHVVGNSQDMAVNIDGRRYDNLQREWEWSVSLINEKQNSSIRTYSKYSHLFRFLASCICACLIDFSITEIPFSFTYSTNCHQSRSSELLISSSICLRVEGLPFKILLESLETEPCSIPSLNRRFTRIGFQATLCISGCLFLLLFFWLPHLQTRSHMWIAKVFFFVFFVFLSRKQRAPLRFASPVSDLGVAVEFRGLSLPPFFLVMGRVGV